MPAKTAVPDFFAKRQLIQRLRDAVMSQVARTVKPDERRQLLGDIELLGSLDEDVIRLEHLLRKATAPMDRGDITIIRQEIYSHLLDMRGPVPTDDLCVRFNMDKDRMLNTLRVLKNDSQIMHVGQGWIALTSSEQRAAGVRAAGRAH